MKNWGAEDEKTLKVTFMILLVVTCLYNQLPLSVAWPVACFQSIKHDKGNGYLWLHVHDDMIILCKTSVPIFSLSLAGFEEVRGKLGNPLWQGIVGSLRAEGGLSQTARRNGSPQSYNHKDLNSANPNDLGNRPFSSASDETAAWLSLQPCRTSEDSAKPCSNFWPTKIIS